MILGIDTDVLVAWAMAGDARHRAARRLVELEITERGGAVALVPQVIHEFLHVVTDPRRFESPLPMQSALRIAWALWGGRDVVRIMPSPEVLPRTLDLIESLHLGRKRILDTALAATLESAGVHRLATFNSRDFEVFSFLEVIDPFSPEN